MFSLFVSFDMCLKWIPIIFMLSVLVSSFYANNNSYMMNSTKKLEFKMVKNEIKMNSKSHEKIIVNAIYSIFILLMIINMLGLISYFFTLTSMLNMCLMISLIFWVSIIIMNLNKNSFAFFSHLVPSGSPLPLSQFMVLIEIISTMIRPMTLAVRLMANLTAGHLILILGSSSLFVGGMIDVPLMLLLILEIMVAIIQAYVFMILVSMYKGEMLWIKATVFT